MMKLEVSIALYSCPHWTGTLALEVPGGRRLFYADETTKDGVLHLLCRKLRAYERRIEKKTVGLFLL